MNNRTRLLKKLAASIVHFGSISDSTKQHILHALNRSEQKKLLQFLRSEYNKKTVIVTTAVPATDELKKSMNSTFTDKNIVYNVDEKITGGVIIKDNDDVYDASVRNYFAQTIQKLQD